MDFSWKFPNDDSIIADDKFKFTKTNKLRTVNYLTYKCAIVGCRAKITMSLDRTKPLTMDFQHNHSPTTEPSTNKKKTSDLMKLKTNQLTKPSPVNKTKKETKNSSSLNKSSLSKKVINISDSVTPPKNKTLTENSKCNSSNVISSTPVVPRTLAAFSVKPKHSAPTNSDDSCITQTPPTSKHNDKIPGVPNSVPCKSNKQKLYIITDSMGRGLAELLLSLLPQLEITQFTYPNAQFHQCLNRAESICAELTKEDFLIIICGTNNTTDLPVNSCPLLSFKSVANLRYKTNVIVSSILYRHDGFSFQNTNIYYANEYLENKCRAMNINYLNINGFFRRRHYTRHGLHLNQAGKRTLSLKLRDFVESHLLSMTIPTVNLNLTQLAQTCSSAYRELPVPAEDNLMDITPPLCPSILDDSFTTNTQGTQKGSTDCEPSNSGQILPINSLLDGSELDSSSDSVFYLSADNLLDDTSSSNKTNNQLFPE
uniref:Uncharacterized protein n=1 Tax=Cacopsylla melanoneura TaxID=428564 RepID=A0A8D8QA56_9HEMI